MAGNSATAGFPGKSDAVSNSSRAVQGPWDDVGPILLEQAALFPAVTQAGLPRLAEISKWLRKEREFAFYGDIDFIPTEQYTRLDAERAQTDALFVLAEALRLVRTE
jgi:hypothetical protein